jgi:protein-tyrosine phosphatase
MIDLHTHVIYGIDDGARDFDEAQEMIRIAQANGTTKMVATSHYIPETYSYTQEAYYEKLNKLRQWIVNEHMNFQLIEGNELFLTRPSVQDLLQQKCLTINKSRYVLVEVTSFMKLQKVEELLDLLQHNGYIPIIAHIERLNWILEDFNCIQQWYTKGYVFQVNAESIVNKRYKENYKSAHELLKKGYVHIVASDGHRSNHRRPVLLEAYNHITQICGLAYADSIFHRNQQIILDNGIITNTEDTHHYSTFKNFLLLQKNKKR